MDTVLLYCSCFDPIDNADLLSAIAACQVYSAKKLIFLPFSRRLNGDKCKASFLDRYNMVKSVLPRKSEDDLLLPLFVSKRLSFYSDDIHKVASFFSRQYEGKDVDVQIMLDHEDFLSLKKDASYTDFYSSGKIIEDLGAQIKKKEDFPSLFDLPLSVWNYIARNKLYFCQELASLLSPKRYLHSISVAKTAFLIASSVKDSDEDLTQKAFLAGLLHDSGKDLPKEEQRKIVQEYFQEFHPVKDFALHQFVSAHLAKERFFISDPKILESIEFHCTGKKEMSTLDKIIYAADKVEPTREFDNQKVRLTCYKDIDKGFVKVLEEQKKYFQQKNIPYADSELTKEMYHSYLGE